MKILIIGSKGFIGRHCFDFFLKQGHVVYGADIIKDNHENYFFLDKEVPDFYPLFKNEKFDLCINASGAANVGFSFENPSVDYELNVSNVQHILCAIKTHNISCRLINFSSAAVYGNPTKLPVKEEDSSSPLSPYGLHKLQSEQLLSYYYKFFNIRSCSLRVFSAYGEGLKKQLFWDLYQKSKVGYDVELYGTGNESRDFIYIKDLLFAVDVIIKESKFKGEVINLSSGVEISIRSAVDCFYEKLNVDVRYCFKGDNRLGDPLNWRADVSKLKKMGFSPKFGLNEGLERYIFWLKENE